MSRIHVPPRVRGRVQISLLRARHRRSYIAGAAGFAATVALLVLDPPSSLKGALHLNLRFLAQAIEDDWQQIARFLGREHEGDRSHR